MKKLGIIGAGFTGTMTAVQLIEKSRSPIEITLIYEGESLNKGIAFNPYSEKHLLNVITGRMSAYPDKPNHFLDWTMRRTSFKNQDRAFIENSFLPRKLYGEYISDIWKEAKKKAKNKKIKLTVLNRSVKDLDISENEVSICFDNNSIKIVDDCIIATGNHLPSNPIIKNINFYSSKNYFRNPWDIKSVKNIKNELPILIIGNGLTMVDTVFGCLENGFKGKIFSISSHGFNILSHRYNGPKYSKLIEELGDNISLYELVKLLNKHIKTAKKLGISPEPIIDSLRPYTQKIWTSFSAKEKSLFISRLRHLWGVARHRIPLDSSYKIQNLRLSGKLHINSGKIIDFIQKPNFISAKYFNKKTGNIETINVSRIINCTGPETNLLKIDGCFLKGCLLKDILFQDELRLGISTDIKTFKVIKKDGKPHVNLFTLGSNLKGELWESTAVNELRIQAEQLAEKLIRR
mgnify:CR=1 FL=1